VGGETGNVGRYTPRKVIEKRKIAGIALEDTE
jgi:hypothetical protein